VNDIITLDGEVIENSGGGSRSLAVSLQRADIALQIATAKASPRNISQAQNRITTLATLDDTMAEECIYAVVRGGKAIRGPSIRLAEIIVSQWGNCRVSARVVHVDRSEKFLEAEGIFHCLETNSATSSLVRRRIADKNGRLYSDDMIIVTGNAACSIAKRNAIISGVPKAVWVQSYRMVERTVAGDIKTLSERRAAMFKAFASFGIKPEDIYSGLGIAGEADITLDHLTTLIGMHSAIKSGEATVEDLFKRTTASVSAINASASIADRFDALAKLGGNDGDGYGYGDGDEMVEIDDLEPEGGY
jgi:hypothetical protein